MYINYKNFNDTGKLQIYVISSLDERDQIEHGVYIDLSETTEDEVNALIKKMLAESPRARRLGIEATEYEIADYFNNFDTFLYIPRYAPIDVIYQGFKILESLENNGQSLEAFMDFYENSEHHISLMGTADHIEFDTSYCGQYESEEDFAADYIERILSDANLSNLYSFMNIPALADHLFSLEYRISDNGHVFKR